MRGLVRTGEARMRRNIRTAALTAILLVPLVSAAPATWRALTSAQPAPSYTYRGTIRAVNARTGPLEVLTRETGLGPLFTSTACGECHEDPAGGRGDEVEVHATAFHSPVCDPLAQEGGPVIQQHTTPALKQALGIDQEPFPPSATARAMRTSPVIFGRGLLDLVPDSVLLAYADPGDRNHDGVKGRPNRFVDGRIGRFGRKAFVPTLREFNAGAFAAERSVTNPAQPTEEDIGGKPIPAGVDAVADPELSQEAFNLTDDFVRFLAPPTPLKPGKDGRRGRELFSQTGCATCHIPTLRTRDSP